jgi:hypothetical protein
MALLAFLFTSDLLKGRWHQLGRRNGAELHPGGTAIAL